jgi:hypothetical protein
VDIEEDKQQFEEVDMLSEQPDKQAEEVDIEEDKQQFEVEDR